MGNGLSHPSLMHVCWLPLHSQGGYRTRVVEEARLLTALGHRVVLAVFFPDWQSRDDTGCRRFRDDLARETGAEIHLLPTSHFFDFAASAEMESEMIFPLSQLAGGRQTPILHGQSIYAAVLALRVARRLPQLRVVFDCHGITPEENLMSQGHVSRSRALEQFEQDVLSNADLSVFVSRRMAEHFERKYGLRPRRQILIPCCVDLDKFSPRNGAHEAFRESIGFNDNIVLTYLGTLAAWQWPEAMFNTFAHLQRSIPSARFLLVIPESDHRQAIDRLAAAGVSPETYVLREMPGPQIGTVLAAGDAGFLLRKDHPVNLVSSPTKFGEYMAAGVPVIATGAVGDFSAWIEERRTGIVIEAADEGASAHSIARICALLEDVRANRELWRGRCRELAAQRLDWNRCIRELSEAYRKLPGMTSAAVVPSGISGGEPAPPARPTGSNEGKESGGAAPAVSRGRREGVRPLQLLFNGHDLKFIRACIRYFSGHPDYEVQIDEWKGHNTFDQRQSEAMLARADVIYCEWCLGNARWYSHHKRPGQRLFIRLHHQEMGLPYRFELEWRNVDALIFTNFKHYDTFRREQPEHVDKAIAVFCDVDCDLFGQPKLHGAEFNLGLVGINPMRKRPELAFEILEKLRRTDSRYRLFFKTRMPWEYWWLWQRPQERDYFTRFFGSIEGSPNRHAVAFDAHGDDMPLWYSKIGFILSTSDHEGSHQAVAEGMAAGCVPVIRDWDGASPLYPSRFVFSSVDEAVELIRRFRQPGVYQTTVAEAKAHARRHFHSPLILRQFEMLFGGADIHGAEFPAMELLPLYRPAGGEMRRS